MYVCMYVYTNPVPGAGGQTIKRCVFDTFEAAVRPPPLLQGYLAHEKQPPPLGPP